MTDFGTNRRALEAAAEAISDLLIMLGVDPDDRGDQGEDYGYVYSEDVKTIIAGAAIKAYKTTLDNIVLEKIALEKEWNNE
jgi:hypothetical protein